MKGLIKNRIQISKRDLYCYNSLMKQTPNRVTKICHLLPHNSLCSSASPSSISKICSINHIVKNHLNLSTSLLTSSASSKRFHASVQCTAISSLSPQPRRCLTSGTIFSHASTPLPARFTTASKISRSRTGTLHHGQIILSNTNLSIAITSSAVNTLKHFWKRARRGWRYSVIWVIDMVESPNIFVSTLLETEEKLLSWISYRCVDLQVDLVLWGLHRAVAFLL